MPERETKRLFVALFPPTDVAAGLQTAVAQLAKEVPPRAIRWTRPGQIHVTLFFLGSIAIARIPQIQSAVTAACDGHQPHPVSVAGLGCFPNPVRPRILWAGLTGDLRPLEGLKKSIEKHLFDCGCVGEDRPFHPHLTLGRVAELNVSARKTVAEALNGERNHPFGEWQIQRVDLMESTLSPQGSTYKTLHSIPLANGRNGHI